MRCSCQVCDTYMVHSEGPELGCVCPGCGNRCKACLGTDSVVSRDHLKRFAADPLFAQSLFDGFDDPAAPDDDDPSPDKWGDGQWED